MRSCKMCLERKVTQALEEGSVLDQLVEGLAVMKGEERDNDADVRGWGAEGVKGEEHCGRRGDD